MRIVKIVLFLYFLIISIIFIQVNLSARMTSTIKGVVYDKDTVKPVKGAEVTVFYYDYGIKEIHKGYVFPRDNAYTRKTDENGKFVFYDMEPREYYISVKKDGYSEFSPYYFIGRRNDKVLKFELKAGKVTNLRIGLEKGGGVEVVVKKNTKSGVDYFKDVEVTLYYVWKEKSKEKLIRISSNKTNNNGKVKYLYLNPMESYVVSIYKERGMPMWDNRIDIYRNKIIKIEKYYDFTSKTSIKGKIITNSKKFLCIIILVNYEDYTMKKTGTGKMQAGLSLWNNKTFEMKYLYPGKYFLFSYFTDLEKKEKGEKYSYEKRELIILEKNKQIIKNIDFRRK